MSVIESNYDSIVTQYENAFSAYRKTYELRTPAPTRQAATGSSIWLYLALAATVIASVAVSGSRTIPEFGGDAIGVAAFIMLEVGMILYAYLRTRTDYDRTTHESLKKRTNQALRWTFVIACMANVHHIAQFKIEDLIIFGLHVGEVVSFVIDISIGLSAPTLAFISGDILGQQSAMRAGRQKQLDTEFDSAMNKWLEGLNTSWNSQKKKWGADIQINSQLGIVNGSLNSVNSNEEDGYSLVHSVNSLNGRNEYQNRVNHSVNSANGYTKNMNSREIIQSYLNEFPEQRDLNLDELKANIEAWAGRQVGRTSIHNVRSELKVNSNGGTNY